MAKSTKPKLVDMTRNLLDFDVNPETISRLKNPS